MISEQRRREVLENLSNGVVQYKEEHVVQWARIALEEGLDAYETIMGGPAAGMEIVGQLYERREYFVPEILMCADALYAGLEILRPHVRSDVAGPEKGRVVIGTVQGDVHDIGKNLIKMMFDVGGFTVYDLGRDVSPERFVEERIRTDADIVALSAMMTTTMMGMKKIVQAVKAENPDVAVMIGGAPVTRDVAKLFGADGYADNAGEAVREAIGIMDRLKGRAGE